MSMTTTTDTFPVQCTSCTEIVDVAADNGDSAAYNCAMCGAEVPWCDAEDFELPCPAEVVLEVRSADHLRIRLPRCFPASDRQLVGRMCLFGIPTLVVVWELVELVLGRPGIASGDLLFHYLIVYSVFGILPGIILIFGSTHVDVSCKRLLVEHPVLGAQSWRGRRNEQIREVIMRTQRSMRALFRGHVHLVVIKAGWWTVQLPDSPNPHVARYVTHIIRRHLQSQGHELHHGRR